MSKKRVLEEINTRLYYGNIYDMEKEFNSVGLTLQATTKGNIILCRINKGRPAMEDYVVIGNPFDNGRALDPQMRKVIREFVDKYTSKPATIQGNYELIEMDGDDTQQILHYLD